MRRGHHAGHNHCGVAHPMGEGNIGIGKSRQRRELFPKLCRNKRPIEVAKGELNRKINPIGERSTEQRTAERAEIECTKLHPGGKSKKGMMMISCGKARLPRLRSRVVWKSVPCVRVCP